MSYFLFYFIFFHDSRLRLHFDGKLQWVQHHRVQQAGLWEQHLRGSSNTKVASGKCDQM